MAGPYVVEMRDAALARRLGAGEMAVTRRDLAHAKAGDIIIITGKTALAWPIHTRVLRELERQQKSEQLAAKRKLEGP